VHLSAYKPCHFTTLLSTDIVARYPFTGTSWCTSLHPNVTRAADTVTTRPDGSILFYHRASPDYISMWEADLVNQEMGDASSMPNPLEGTTFGGILSLSSGALVSSGPSSLTTTVARTSHVISIAGGAGECSLSSRLVLQPQRARVCASRFQ
jgi:hypothetical protein